MSDAEAKGSSSDSASSSVSGEREGRPDIRGTLKVLLRRAFSVGLDLGLRLLRGVVEVIDFRCVVDSGLLIFLMAEAEGRGGLKAFGGILYVVTGVWYAFAEAVVSRGWCRGD